MAKRAAFRVSSDWIDYAHQPAADDGQPTACELVALPLLDDGKTVLIPPDRPDLVEEVVSVAGLYTSDSNVQSDDRIWFRAYPANVIRRGKAWLANK